jgi:putative methyltransferase (TIGR04325 family)
MYSSIRHAWTSRRIWDGLYRSFDEVPSRYENDFEEKRAESVYRATRILIEESRKHHSIPYEVIGEHNLLPLLAATVTKNDGTLTILDFGGGMGVSYVHLVNSLPAPSKIDYHVIEVPAICEKGSMLFEGDPRIHFHTDFPDDLERVDIVYVSSSLQYIRDFRGLIRRLCAYVPGYVFFVKLSAGDMPTYVTAQKNIRGAVIPYQFVNVDELVKVLESCHYELVFRGALERVYRQTNFPENYRLYRTCNLLFRLAGPQPVEN